MRCMRRIDERTTAMTTLSHATSNELSAVKSARHRSEADPEIQFDIGECALGSILVARSDRGVCAILLGDDRTALVRGLRDRFPRAQPNGSDGDFEELVAKVGR